MIYSEVLEVDQCKNKIKKSGDKLKIEFRKRTKPFKIGQSAGSEWYVNLWQTGAVHVFADTSDFRPCRAEVF